MRRRCARTSSRRSRAAATSPFFGPWSGTEMQNARPFGVVRFSFPEIRRWLREARSLHVPCACARACARGARLPPFREHAFPTASRKSAGASSREIRLRAASSSSALSAPGRHCCHVRRPGRWESPPSAHLGPETCVFDAVPNGEAPSSTRVARVPRADSGACDARDQACPAQLRRVGGRPAYCRSPGDPGGCRCDVRDHANPECGSGHRRESGGDRYVRRHPENTLTYWNKDDFQMSVRCVG
jgi:hypothetical protein